MSMSVKARVTHGENTSVSYIW